MAAAGRGIVTFPRRMPTRFWHVALAGATIACSQPSTATVVGQWGGTEVSLVIDRSGGNLTYQCGSGTIDSSWTLTSDGQFAGSGEHYLGGGPAPSGGRPPHAALYAGQVNGNTLTLTVTIPDLDEVLGPYQLKRNGAPVSEVCV